jgi:hypothetical protein
LPNQGAIKRENLKHDKSVNTTCGDDFKSMTHINFYTQEIKTQLNIIAIATDGNSKNKVQILTLAFSCNCRY